MKPIQPMQVDQDKKQYVVQYHSYDPRYPAVFDRVSALIQAEAGPVRIEHVGSSAIPGVGGRKVLDIAIPAPESAHQKLREVLYRLGFADAPFPHHLPVQIGCIEDQEQRDVQSTPQTYQLLVYIVSPSEPMLRIWLEYRDYLRAHPEAAEAYGQVKREVLAAGHRDGESYQQAKTPFIVELNARIREKG